MAKAKMALQDLLRQLLMLESCKGEDPKRDNTVDKARVPALVDGASNELLSLATVHNGLCSPREADKANTNIEQFSALWLESSIVFIIASLFSAFVRTVVSSLLHLASASHGQDASSGGRHCAKNVSFGDVSPSSLIESTSSAPTKSGKVRQEKSNLLTIPTTSSVFSALLCGVHRSHVFV
ncbi:hypothetical protein SLS58_008800 [Diplodia intermedia]|uniref:Uncharacterized protein n=1 Tax=Diplodia intermedia TaxID=856260 RepID=A0ABR3TGL8_9PEZI